VGDVIIAIELYFPVLLKAMKTGDISAGEPALFYVAILYLVSM
jgi:hypothetical protein